jgi:hypothetical protein
MIVVAKFYCTTALLKCRRRGSYCYSFPYCLLLLTATLAAAISIAETTYSAIFIQKMRRNAVAAAPTAVAAATAAAATTAAAAVSFRLYDYFSLQCNYKPHPRRSSRHELVDGTVFIFLLKFPCSCHHNCRRRGHRRNRRLITLYSVWRCHH